MNPSIPSFVSLAFAYWGVISRRAIAWLLVLVAAACASSEKPHQRQSSILEPMESSVVSSETPSKPAYERLATLLFSLGYDPVGMQFETEANLDLLYQVFSHPAAKHRKIKLVYTGFQMAYDKKGEALTVGGMTNVVSILGFIQRYIPLNSKPNAPIVHPSKVPPLPVFPSPTPTPVPSLSPTIPNDAFVPSSSPAFSPNSGETPIPSPEVRGPSPETYEKVVPAQGGNDRGGGPTPPPQPPSLLPEEEKMFE